MVIRGNLTSFVAIITHMTMDPTATLSKAAACPACFALDADLAPMKFPTLADAATPIGSYEQAQDDA